MEFDNPKELGVGGKAMASLVIEEPSVIKTKKSLKPLSNNSFKEGEPKLEKEIPPMSADVEGDLQ